MRQTPIATLNRKTADEQTEQKKTQANKLQSLQFDAFRETETRKVFNKSKNGLSSGWCE